MNDVEVKRKRPLKILSEADELFCMYYMQGLSQIDATKKAYGSLGEYYGNKSPLKKPHIQARLQELSKEIRGKHKDKIADITEILEFLTSVIRGGEMEDEVEREIMNGENDNIEKIREFSKSAPIKDKVKAAEILVKTNYIYTTMNPNADDKIIILGEEDILD